MKPSTSSDTIPALRRFSILLLDRGGETAQRLIALETGIDVSVSSCWIVGVKPCNVWPIVYRVHCFSILLLDRGGETSPPDTEPKQPPLSFSILLLDRGGETGLCWARLTTARCFSILLLDRGGETPRHVELPPEVVGFSILLLDRGGETSV